MNRRSESVFPNGLFDAEARARMRVEDRRAAARFAVNQARQLYFETRTRAQLARAWAVLTRRSSALPTLAEIVDGRAGRGRHAIGGQTIALCLIFGSEGRSADFDAAFRPAQDYTRERWFSVAAAMLQGLSMPPIDVIQVGGRYFVRDGHHRVSVARALGQADIDANVTVWELADAPAAEAVGHIARALA